MRTMSAAILLALLCLLWPSTAQAQTVTGSVHDQSGGPLPGVTVELRTPGGAPLVSSTGADGSFALDRVPPGRYRATFTLINFASLRRDLDVGDAGGTVRLDGVPH